MSIYKVERKVDTVIVEMDVAVAERLVEVLEQVVDTSRDYLGKSSLVTLRYMLEVDAEVRSPSPLYIAEPKDGYVLLRNTTSDELDERRASR